MSLRAAALGRLACLLLLSSPAVSRAQEGGPVLKIKELNRQAIADYAAEDYESAQLGLREAVALSQRAGLAEEPLMARIFVNLGAVYINGFKDSKRGVRALESALAIEPDIKLTDTLVTPELREVFDRLQGRARPRTPAPAPPPAEAGSPPPAEPPGRPAAPESPPAALPARAVTPAAPPTVPGPPDRGPAAPPPASGPGIAPAAPAPAARPGAPTPPAAIVSTPSAPAAETPPAPAAVETAPGPRAEETEARPAKVAIVRPPRAARRRGAPEEPDLPARVPQPVYCPTPDEAPPSERITLNCVLQPEVSASKVFLYYRVPGDVRFRSASTVRSSKGWYRGVIPASVVQGRSLHFYVEARDATNEVVGSAGRDDSPNVVLIREGAVAVAQGLFAGVRSRRRPGAASGEEDPLEAAARAREREIEAAGIRRRQVGSVYVAVGVGSGYGVHRTQRLEFYQDAEIDAGWIPSGLLHLAPEVGYQFSENFAFSVLARLQVISQTGSGDMRVGNPARSAFAVLARPQLLLGRRNLQLNLSAYAGGGDGFRLTVPPQPPRFRRNDSVRGGPFVAGAGAGALFHLSHHVAVAADLRWLFGVPDFAGVADLGLALQLAF